jgi:hypothetical protein
MPPDVWAAFLFVPPLVKDLRELAEAFEVLRCPLLA